MHRLFSQWVPRPCLPGYRGARPAPLSQCTAFVAADSFSAIAKLLRDLESKLGGTLNAFEVMWADFYETILGASDRHTSPIEKGHDFYALIEARGGDQAEDANRFEQMLGDEDPEKRARSARAVEPGKGYRLMLSSMMHNHNEMFSSRVGMNRLIVPVSPESYYLPGRRIVRGCY